MYDYQSIPSLTILWANPRGVRLKERIPPPPEVSNLDPWAENSAKAPPPGQLFSKIQQKTTTHETEIKKNSTEILICLEI